MGLASHFARQVLTPASKPEARVEVTEIESSDAVEETTLVWLRGPDSALKGSYSFIFDAHDRETQHEAGHARLGPVVADRSSPRGQEVARQVLSVEQGNLRVGAKGRITGWWFTRPEQLGHDVTLVSIPMPDGVGWGWLIVPDDAVPGKWAIHVHGRGALPQETLRGVRPFAESGITSLVVAYRNDSGAPRGHRSRYGLGLAEYLDVDAAVGWAHSQGAREVTLVGWSMGATACVLASARGDHSAMVTGLVLDSPALDWTGILRRQARLAGAPELVANLAIGLMQLGCIRGAIAGERGTDMSALTSARLVAAIRVPTLIHASADDTFVPWRGSLRAAQLKPSLVRLHPAQGEHVKLWNVDQVAWERETRHFIASLSQT